MCGINGILGLENFSQPIEVIKKMNSALAHRGPDNEGLYSDDLVALGHRRLSIINTSADGNQPFKSDSGEVILIFNGEIYNYLEIKELLKNYNFKTGSDTEVILAAYLEWGMNCLRYFNGMFSLAIWDKRVQKLFIARDRIGIKPLYYTESDDSFVFSSEIRALTQSKVKEFKLSKNSLIEYLRYQTVHSPRTILEGVYSLPAGHYLTLSDNERILTEYWNPVKAASVKEPNPGNVQADILNLLRTSVELRMRADVPFGAFLSGGIDSSAIVSLMSQVSVKPIETFSVIFNEREFSEAKYAEIIAKKYRTNHHEILLTPDDFLNEIPSALLAMDHPSGDGPNTYIVSKVTKNSGITMALSGLGGDELFAGYSIFKRSISLAQKKWLNSFAGVFRNAAGLAIKTLKPSMASAKIHDVLNQEYIDIPHSYSVNRKILLDNEISALLNFDEELKNPLLVRCKALTEDAEKNQLGLITQVSLLEMETYMRNVLLRDSDQMSMAHSLEVRVPFLDHNLVEYSLALSDKLKYPHTPKELLVKSLGELLPNEIVNRPKMGFVLPWENWMRKELKNYCEGAIQKLADRPEFNKQALLNLWSKFLNGDKLTTWSRIWHLVTLSNWLAQNEIK